MPGGKLASSPAWGAVVLVGASLNGSACVSFNSASPQAVASVAEPDPDAQIFVMLDNRSGADVVVDFVVEGIDQHVPVHVDHLHPVTYGCVSSIQFAGLTTIDPDTGQQLAQFELQAELVSPDDFACGDVIVVAIQPDAVSLSVVGL